MLIGRFGTPSFAGMHSIKGQLARAQAGGALNMRELLEIAGVLRCIRSLNSWRSNCEGVNTCLDERFSFLIPNKYLENTITTSIISVSYTHLDVYQRQPVHILNSEMM